MLPSGTSPHHNTEDYCTSPTLFKLWMSSLTSHATCKLYLILSKDCDGNVHKHSYEKLEQRTANVFWKTSGWWISVSWLRRRFLTKEGWCLSLWLLGVRPNRFYSVYSQLILLLVNGEQFRGQWVNNCYIHSTFGLNTMLLIDDV